MILVAIIKSLCIMVKSYLMLMQMMHVWYNETSYEKLSRETVNGIFESIKKRQEIHTIIYFGTLSNVDTYITAASGIAKVVITSPSGLFEFYENAGFNNQMVFMAMGDLNNTMKQQEIYQAFKDVQGYTRGIFILKQHDQRNIPYLKRHFTWCWKRGFADAIVLLENTTDPVGIKAFGYIAYPELKIIDVSISNDTTYFPRKMKNMRGAKIRTPMKYDPPRVFSSNDTETKFMGYAYNLMNEFLRSRNGALDPISYSSVYNIEEIIEQLSNGTIEFSVHPFYPVSGIHLSYPIRMLRMCLMVPSKGEVPIFAYYVRAFGPYMWLMILMVLLALSIVTACWFYIARHGQSSFDIGRAMLFVLRLLINQATPMPRISTLLVPYTSLLLIILLFGFLLVNLYTASLTSFFSTTLWNRQLNTLQDMIRENLSVHVGYFGNNEILKNYVLPRGFGDLLVPRHGADIINDIINLTPGYAYAGREDILKFSLSQYLYSKNPSFRLADECITTLPVGYLLPSHSQFEISLNVFIMHCDAAGLIDYWMEKSVKDGYSTGIVHIRSGKKLLGPQPLTVSELMFAWMILGYGWTCAVLAFLLERICAYLARIRFYII